MYYVLLPVPVMNVEILQVEALIYCVDSTGYQGKRIAGRQWGFLFMKGFFYPVLAFYVCG